MLRGLPLRGLHTLAVLFCLLAYPDEQPTCRSRTFGRVSVSLAEPRARDLLCKRQWTTVTAVDREVSCWRWNRHELNCAGGETVTNWPPCFFLLAGGGSECGVYIARHDGDQILCQGPCLARRVTGSRNENIWSREQISTWRPNVRSRSVRQVTLVLIWTPADKISFQPRSQACS